MRNSNFNKNIEVAKNFFGDGFTYAIVGATTNPEKYGNIVLNNLRSDGYNVVPINPNYDDIEGLKCYKNISDCSENISVAVFVIPPNSASMMKEQLLSKKITKVWMQPGSESQEMALFCKDNKIEYIQDACIMVVKNLI